ncbi:MAG: signal peptidase II [Dehalococcoidia bacterium]|nr:signal peptidase II [Dehalococcoidia bacterium]
MARGVISRLAVLRETGTAGLWQHVQTAPLVGLVALELDQLSKLLVRETVQQGQAIPDDSAIRITHVVNPGILFGAPASPLVSLILPLGMILAVLAIYWRFQRSGSTLLNIGTGLFVGGTLGNLLDRIIFGHVTDFIEVVTFGGEVRTIFNLADVCIIAGIVILEIFLVRHILRLIRQKGLNYNPVKPVVAGFIRRRFPRQKK